MSSTCRLEGWLVKKKAVEKLGFKFGYDNQRWFTIQEVKGNDSTEWALCYFKSKRDKEAKGWIYLKDVNEISDDERTISIISSARNLTVEAHTSNEHMMWLQSLVDFCPQAKNVNIKSAISRRSLHSLSKTDDEKFSTLNDNDGKKLLDETVGPGHSDLDRSASLFSRHADNRNDSFYAFYNSSNNSNPATSKKKVNISTSDDSQVDSNENDGYTPINRLESLDKHIARGNSNSMKYRSLREQRRLKAASNASQSIDLEEVNDRMRSISKSKSYAYQSEDFEEILEGNEEDENEIEHKSTHHNTEIESNTNNGKKYHSNKSGSHPPNSSVNAPVRDANGREDHRLQGYRGVGNDSATTQRLHMFITGQSKIPTRKFLEKTEFNSNEALHMDSKDYQRNSERGKTVREPYSEDESEKNFEDEQEDTDDGATAAAVVTGSHRNRPERENKQNDFHNEEFVIDEELEDSVDDVIELGKDRLPSKRQTHLLRNPHTVPSGPYGTTIDNVDSLMQRNQFIGSTSSIWTINDQGEYVIDHTESCDSNGSYPVDHIRALNGKNYNKNNEDFEIVEEKEPTINLYSHHETNGNKINYEKTHTTPEPFQTSDNESNDDSPSSTRSKETKSFENNSKIKTVEVPTAMPPHSRRIPPVSPPSKVPPPISSIINSTTIKNPHSVKQSIDELLAKKGKKPSSHTQLDTLDAYSKPPLIPNSQVDNYEKEAIKPNKYGDSDHQSQLENDQKVSTYSSQVNSKSTRNNSDHVDVDGDVTTVRKPKYGTNSIDINEEGDDDDANANVTYAPPVHLSPSISGQRKTTHDASTAPPNNALSPSKAPMPKNSFSPYKIPVQKPQHFSFINSKNIHNSSEPGKKGFNEPEVDDEDFENSFDDENIVIVNSKPTNSVALSARDRMQQQMNNRLVPTNKESNHSSNHTHGGKLLHDQKNQEKSQEYNRQEPDWLHENFDDD